MATKTLFFLRGLPASGKSTWALDYVSAHPNTVRVNKDDIRSMMHNNVFSKDRENITVGIERWIVNLIMADGIKNVIVDNTHLGGTHEDFYKDLCDKYWYEFKIRDFNTPVDECVARDKLRPNPVGEAVIRKMAKDSKLSAPPEFEKVDVDKSLPACIIVDIDWTLAYMQGRSPYDYSKVLTDGAHEDVMQMIKYFSDAYSKKRNAPIHTIIVSWRKDECKMETIEWLTLNGFTFDSIHMRKSDDVRKDSIVKYEILQDILREYNPIAVFDDRNQVVKMWREAWLRCYQVADWNF